MRGGLTRVGLLLGLGLALPVLVLWGSGSLSGLGTWAAEGQRAAQNALAGAIRGIRAGETGALAALLGLAFAYGVFHAAGPGHGKVLIGGYGMARRVPLGRLAALALASSLAQAAVAVVLVHAGVWLFDWTRTRMVDMAEGTLLAASHAAVAAIGLWLAWRGGRALMALRRPPVPGGGGAADGHGHRHGHGDLHGIDHAHAHGHSHSHAHAHAHAQDDHRHGPAQSHPAPARGGDTQAPGDHVHRHGPAQAARGHPAPAHDDHVHDAGCGHAHGPSLDEVAAVTSPREALVLVAGIAMRPCTGALLVLVLTWQMGIAAAGIAAAFAMGLGTATVTLAVAGLAVWAREGAFAAMPARRVAGIVPAVELTLGLAIAGLGLVLLQAAV